jgi:dCTP deaminase
MQHGLLCDEDIKRHVNQPNSGIIIRPFKADQLNTTSYDVRLGRYYYKPEAPPHLGDGIIRSSKEKARMRVFNPFSKECVSKTYGHPREAITARRLAHQLGKDSLDGIKDDERVILLEPGAFILAHTQEFIGGYNDVSTAMQARSSTGRCGLTVCACAGWGDIGYVNRWTMEIKNLNASYPIILVVGRRYAQIVFERVHRSQEAFSYAVSGKYGLGYATAISDPSLLSHDELLGMWTPTNMVPKLYKDKESL